MMLPNGERAIVDIAKLTEYCLSLDHPRGRHKARVFTAALGFFADDAEQLRGALVDAAHTEEARLTDQDQYGQRYTLDFIMNGPSGEGRVRSCWIVRSGEDFPG